VPRGYIVALVDTETSLSPDHGAFARDIAFAADRIQAEGADSGSAFFGRVAPATALMGHSMGGGSSVLAVQYSPNITAVVTMAAADTNPSAIAAAPGVSAPSLVFAASKDNVAAPASNQIPIYNGLASAEKALITITNASHCGFSSGSFTCTAAEGFVCIFCSFIELAVQQGITIQLTEKWLNYTLRGCDEGFVAFGSQLQSLVSASSVTFTSSFLP